MASHPPLEGTRVTLGSGASALMSPRGAVLHVHVSGPVSLGGASILRRRVTAACQEGSHERALVDVRDASGPREGWIEWAGIGRASAQVALVTSDELLVAELNMRALATATPLRAFAALSEAHRFASRRASTASFRRVETPSPARRSELPPDGVESARRSETRSVLRPASAPRFEALVDAAGDDERRR